MAEQLGEAVLRLKTDDRQYLQGMRQAEGRAQKHERQIQKTERAAKGLGARLGSLRTRLAGVAQKFTAATVSGQRTEGVFRRVGRAAQGLHGKIASLLAIFSGAALIGAIISTNAEFQSLQATLETFIGSRAGAAEVFEIIKDFAARTPFSVRQVTTAFNRMLATGLTPSIKALTAFGNVASGSGKSVLDFVEAVADAAVGEFERLKEFGIKASVQGDKVKLTFKGVETTVAKTASAIEKALIKIGETKFAGAIDRQAATLRGAISNAGDAVDQFFEKVGKGGFRDALAQFIRRFTQLISNADGFAAALSRLLTGGLDLLEAIFINVARAAKVAHDNSALLLRILLAFAGARIAQTAVRIGIGFVKLAAAVRTAGVVLTAFSAVQSLTRRGLLVTAGIIALVAGKWDDFKAAIDGVVKKVGELIPSIKSEAKAALASLGVDLDGLNLEFEDFITKTDEASKSVEDYDARLRQLLGNTAATKQGVNELTTASKDAGEAFKSASDFGARHFEEFATSAIDGSKSVKGAFKDMVNGILSELVRLGTSKAIKSVLSLFGSSLGVSAGPQSGGHLGAGFNFADFFGGFFDEGGVPPAGKASIVGESGPELRVFNGRDRIVPLDRVGGGLTINQQNTFEGFDPGSQAALEGRMQRLKAETVDAAVQATRAERARTPGMYRGKGAG